VGSSAEAEGLIERVTERVEQTVGGELGQPTAVQAIALGLGADRCEQLRRGNDLRRVALGPEAARQAEAGGAVLVDDLGDPSRTERSRSIRISSRAGWTQVIRTPRPSLYRATL